MRIQEGDFFELNNGDFCAVMEIFMKESYNPDYVRFRVVKSCKGKQSKKSRIGKPYTYQLISQIQNFKKRIKRQIGKEEILKLLFKQQDINTIDTHKTIKPIPLDYLKPVGKPKVTLFKFNAVEIRKGDITRFRNLLTKLKVKIETLEMPKNLKGYKCNVVMVDEIVKVDFRKVGKWLEKLKKWKNK